MQCWLRRRGCAEAASDGGEHGRAGLRARGGPPGSRGRWPRDGLSCPPRGGLSRRRSPHQGASLLVGAEGFPPTSARCGGTGYRCAVPLVEPPYLPSHPRASRAARRRASPADLAIRASGHRADRALAGRVAERFRRPSAAARTCPAGATSSAWRRAAQRGDDLRSRCRREGGAAVDGEEQIVNPDRPAPDPGPDMRAWRSRTSSGLTSRYAGVALSVAGTGAAPLGFAAALSTGR